MKEFFISDTHFQHAKIIEYCGRPFADVQSMNEEMISRWNSVVAEGDTVYHGGDFCFIDPEMFPEEDGAGKLSLDARREITMRLFVPRLNGNIVLIKGNHDPRKRPGVLDTGIVSYVSELTLGNLLLTHKPKLDIDANCINVHGHIHNYALKDLDKYHIKDYSKYICTSAEMVDYTPIPMEELRRRIDAQRAVN